MLLGKYDWVANLSDSKRNLEVIFEKALSEEEWKCLGELISMFDSTRRTKGICETDKA
jgi:hypothetical protein